MLELRHIHKTFASRTILHNLNLTIKNGEFFSLLGPSGCGKTTLLRIIAGLDRDHQGEIWLDGERIDTLSPQDRPFNMVFQKYALFPHLTVAQNLEFGLKIKKLSSSEIKTRVLESLALVNLSDYANRLPETLSGGQQQRVALARALVNRPKILLLDEPLSALDQRMREYMQTELRFLQKKLGITFIFVTHDQEEAMVMSDRIGVMNNGYLEQVSSPRELYELPETLFTAQFIGQMSNFKAEYLENDGDLFKIKLSNNLFLKGRSPGSSQPTELPTKNVQAFIRPEKLKIYTNPEDLINQKNQNVITGTLAHQIFRGTTTELLIKVSETTQLKAYSTHDLLNNIQIGDCVYIGFNPEDTFIYNENH